MDFRQLVYIVTIADCQNISKAARELYVSQPSLSHFVAKTETELGVKLFDRNTSPLSLTYAGERYVETAREILKLHQNLQKEFSEITQSKKGKISIGISQGRGAFMLPLILKEYRKEYPDIVIRTVEGSSDSLKEMLKKGQMDFMIATEDVVEPGLKSEVIYQEELLLVTKKENLLVDKDYIEWEQMRDLPFIMLKKGHGIRSKCDRLFKEHNIIPQIIFETTSNTMALRLAAVGEGVAIVPKRSLIAGNYQDEIAVLRLGQEKIAWNINVIYLADHYINVIEREFIETTKNVFKHM